MKTCPFCAEEIQDEAIKCKHCSEMLNTDPPSGSTGKVKQSALNSNATETPQSTAEAKSSVKPAWATASRKKLAALGAVLLVGLILCGVFFQYRRIQAAEAQKRAEEQQKIEAALQAQQAREREQREQQQAKELAAEEQSLKAAITCFARIKSGLDVGTKLGEFKLQLKDAKMALEELADVKFVQIPEARSKVTSSLEAALSDYLDSYVMWQNEIEIGSDHVYRWAQCKDYPPGRIEWDYSFSNHVFPTDHRHFSTDPESSSVTPECQAILDRMGLTKAELWITSDHEIAFKVNLDAVQQKLWTSASAKVIAAKKASDPKDKSSEADNPTPTSSPSPAYKRIPERTAYKEGKANGQAGAILIPNETSSSCTSFTNDWTIQDIECLVEGICEQDKWARSLSMESSTFRKGFKVGLKSGLVKRLLRKSVATKSASRPRASDSPFVPGGRPRPLRNPFVTGGTATDPDEPPSDPEPIQGHIPGVGYPTQAPGSYYVSPSSGKGSPEEIIIREEQSAARRIMRQP